ncbi:uncharacterized protein PV09_05276 [Verruconis gallopava]|uniref:Peptidase S26 domain-containing protein n=1 Tax=Verruconis gallopava TaxID=253628 RepID=A0A0D2AAD7_9PEZI|nr:uncharacterized protein PV09_05276 [Verruconis gallopava]KIW03510.1 hypothetical protein PV09_05276 [Verruconis gallopava]
MNTLLRTGLRNAIPCIHSTPNIARFPRPILPSSRCLTTKLRMKKGPNASLRSQKEQPSSATSPSQSQEEDQSRRHNKHDRGSEPKYWRSSYKIAFIFAIEVFLITHFVTANFYAITFPYGASMLPTMYVSGECVVISKHYALGRDIRVGDVVCALHPMFPDGNAVIKRVLGMPGDIVCDGVFENGEPRMIKVPRGHCWLAGDNAGFSRDSRIFGAVPLGLVTGKVVWRLFPWERFGRIENTIEPVDEWEAAPV